MSENRSDLIYDIGLFDGSDTAYYLFRGFKVVAVDANPLMVEQARARFAREIEDHRLKLLNVGISETPGTATFFVSDVPQWSSFERALASRDGTTATTPVSIPLMPFSHILSEHGVPHYLKIDIEGNDHFCVNGLRGVEIPRYISVETECAGSEDSPSEEKGLEMLYYLRDAGYRKFKLVDQVRGWRSVRRNNFANFCLHVAESAARGRLQMKGTSKIAQKFSDSSRLAALGFSFARGSSGPWGDDIPGDWMTFKDARTVYLRERRSFLSSGKPAHQLWFDWHATY